MSMNTEMMDMLATKMAGVDAMMMQECMEALAACEQACVMCADASMGEDMQMCRSMCMNMADMAHATMRMMMRPAAMSMPMMMSAMDMCMKMAEACASCCGEHADMSENAMMCQRVCMNLAATCQRMMEMMSKAG